MAQSVGDETWSELIEMWMEQNEAEEIPDEWVEQLQMLIEEPINLNDTSQCVLQECLLLSDFQQNVIRAYIAQNGPLASVSELYLMNGFDSLTIGRIRPFVTVKPLGNRNVSLGEMLRGGHSNLRGGTKTVWPTSRGYKEDVYKGDPFRVYFRYRYHYGDRIAFQLSGDKDAGEPFLFTSGEGNNRSQKGFDYYGYYLMLNDFGRVRHVVLGKYQLQFGQGLTLWSGFAPWFSGTMPLRRYGAGIKPAGAFCEYGYLRGMATTVALPSGSHQNDLELTLFYSNVDRDATVSRDSDEFGDIQYQGFYQSGYHRTENEMAKKANLNEQLFGGHLAYRYDRLEVGGTAYGTWLANPIVPVNYIYNAFAFRGNRNFNAGVDATFRYRRMLFFGELSLAENKEIRKMSALSGWLPLASVAGVQFQIDGNNMVSIAAHYGSPVYQNLHANAIGQESNAQNGSGVSLFFKSQIRHDLKISTVVDLFRFPWMRYRVYSPSTGSDCRLWISKTLENNAVFEMQYRYRAEQRNSDAGLYYVENTRRQQLRLSLVYQPSSWRLLSRVLFSWFDCDDHESQQGFLLFQEASYHTMIGDKNLTIGGQMSVFDVSDYDARIYNYESDLVYELSVPMLTGRGVRCGIVVRHDLTKSFSIALKYAMAVYPENKTLGSGYDRVEGPIRSEAKIQMRLRF